MLSFPAFQRRNPFSLAGVALFALLTLAACGGSTSTSASNPTATTAPAATATTAPAATATTASSGTATIAMGSFSFTNNSVTIKAGQSVTFNSAGTHILVTGSHGAFTAESGAPSEFNSASGTAFSPGDSKTVVFANAGTYNITCMIHPSMQATITVIP